MNIDLNALKAIEEQQGIAMEDLLATIANALLFSYREFKEDDAGAKGDDSCLLYTSPSPRDRG